MAQHSKRFHFLKKLIPTGALSIEQGLQLMKTLGTANFIESAEAHISLNIELKQENQSFRPILFFPHGTGRVLKFAILGNFDSSFAFLSRPNIKIFRIDEVESKIIAKSSNFDIIVVTPECFPFLTKFGKILGPKGLMPSLKLGTVTSNIEKTIHDFETGKRELSPDKTGILHTSFGKLNFSLENLKENFMSLLNSIEKNKPRGIKGKFIKTVYICSTMSPGIKLDLPL